MSLTGELMEQKYLKRAMIFGTSALIWSIPSLNILGIIAAIITWIAYSSHRKGASETAGVLYIAASVLSVAFDALIWFFCIDIIGRRFFIMVTSVMIIGVILYILASLNCMKGAKTLKESGGEKNSFFD